MEDKIIETICKRDGDQFNYKFVVTGTFEGDEGEHVNKERILDVAECLTKAQLGNGCGMQTLN